MLLCCRHRFLSLGGMCNGVINDPPRPALKQPWALHVYPRMEPVLLVVASVILVRLEVLSAKNTTISVLLAWWRLWCRSVLFGLEEVFCGAKVEHPGRVEVQQPARKATQGVQQPAAVTWLHVSFRMCLLRVCHVPVGPAM